MNGNRIVVCPSGTSDIAPDVSVVIPVRRHSDALVRLLATLREQAPPGVIREIIVVQDGSEDDLAEICARYGATRIELAEPRGPAYARNAGAAAATSPLLLLLDADVLCPPGLFEAIARNLADCPDAGAISFLNPPYDVEAGAVANFASTLEYHWLSSCLRGAASAPLPGVSCRNAVVRRAAFEAIGGFDTTFRTNAIEDYDFGKRFTASFKSMVAAAPLVPHAYPRRFSRLVRNYAVRSSTYMRYRIRNRVAADPVQTTVGEAALRLVGSAAWMCLMLAAIPRVAAPAGAAAGLAICLYAWQLRSYLREARSWSGSWRFAAAALAIHLATAPVIVVSGFWGAMIGWITLATEAGRRREIAAEVKV